MAPRAILSAACRGSTVSPTCPFGQLVSWGDHLKIEHPQIDAQHRAIFEMAGEIGATWREREGSDRLA